MNSRLHKPVGIRLIERVTDVGLVAAPNKQEVDQFARWARLAGYPAFGGAMWRSDYRNIAGIRPLYLDWHGGMTPNESR